MDVPWCSSASAPIRLTVHRHRAHRVASNPRQRHLKTTSQPWRRHRGRIRRHARVSTPILRIPAPCRQPHVIQSTPSTCRLAAHGPAAEHAPKNHLRLRAELLRVRLFTDPGLSWPGALRAASTQINVASTRAPSPRVVCRPRTSSPLQASTVILPAGDARIVRRHTRSAQRHPPLRRLRGIPSVRQRRARPPPATSRHVVDARRRSVQRVRSAQARSHLPLDPPITPTPLRSPSSNRCSNPRPIKASRHAGPRAQDRLRQVRLRCARHRGVVRDAVHLL